MEKEIIESRGGFTLMLEQDMDPMDPRGWDNLGEMIAYHPRYTLGDHGRAHGERWTSDDAKRRIIDIAGMDEGEDIDETLVVAMGRIEKRGGVILPLYLYDHSGITMIAGHAPAGSNGWDTSMVGFIIAPAEKIVTEYGDCHKRTRAKTVKRLLAEVKTYAQYLEGDVWTYIIEGEDGVEDSCSGFFGSEDAIAEGREALARAISAAKKAHEERKKVEIKNHVPLEKRSACNV